MALSLIKEKMRCMPFIISLFFSASLSAQTINAEDLEKLCASNKDAERTTCLLIVKIYMDGFIEGAGKGVIDVYKYDPQVKALVMNIKMKEMAPRMESIVNRATCIQRVSSADMVNAYIEFVRENPSVRQKHYRQAMTRAIVAKFC